MIIISPKTILASLIGAIPTLASIVIQHTYPQYTFQIILIVIFIYLSLFFGSVYINLFKENKSLKIKIDALNKELIDSKENNKGLIENNTRIKNERENYRNKAFRTSRLLNLFFISYQVSLKDINKMKAIEETTNVENN